MDQFSTAVHEVGHAVIQAVFNIGPQSVRVFEKDDNWHGQSLPQSFAIEGTNITRLLVSQLAGPIAQIVIAPDSIGTAIEQFKGSFLNPALALLGAGGDELAKLGWAGDLTECKLNYVAQKGAAIYDFGGFLFAAEKALFSAFNNDEVQSEVKRLAELLCDSPIGGEDFCKAAHKVIHSASWASLLQLNLEFSPPFNFQ